MFHACVQRFDGMDEKFFGGELNKALGLAQIYPNGKMDNIHHYIRVSLTTLYSNFFHFKSSNGSFDQV